MCVEGDVSICVEDDFQTLIFRFAEQHSFGGLVHEITMIHKIVGIQGKINMIPSS